MNLGKHVSFQLSLDVYLEVYQGSYANSILVFLSLFLVEPLYCFPLWLHQFVLGLVTVHC